MGNDTSDTTRSRIEGPEATESHNHQNPSDLLDLIGGEPLEGSGFESEVPDDDCEWRGSK